MPVSNVFGHNAVSRTAPLWVVPAAAPFYRQMQLIEQFNVASIKVDVPDLPGLAPGHRSALAVDPQSYGVTTYNREKHVCAISFDYVAHSFEGGMLGPPIAGYLRTFRAPDGGGDAMIINRLRGFTPRGRQIRPLY